MMKMRMLVLGAVAAFFGSCFGGALQVRQGGDGALSFPGGGLSARVFLPGWEGARVACDWNVRADGVRTFALKDALGVLFAGTSRCEVVESGALDCEISLACVRACALESVCLSYAGAYAPVGGRVWKADERQLTLPKERRSSIFLADGRAGRFELPLPRDEFLRLEFPGKVSYYAQDSRQWNPNWSLRMGGRGGSFTCPKGERISWKFRLSSASGIEFRQDRPYEIRKGDVWAPLRNPRNIVPGSALDFSGHGLQDAPAGKYGWLRSSGGHFEFAGRPGVAQRFYGVNLCSTANYLDRSHADELVDRLVRLGYNSIRIHHHDDLWRDRVSKDRLDYLVSRAIERGLYITTDLYVSRKVRWREIGVDCEGEVDTQLFKTLVTCHEPAYRNWCGFAREFLEHVNPYTGRAYKDEPGMPLVSLVNEGMLGMNWGKSGKPTDERIRAAWREFGGKGPVPAPGNAAFVRFDDWLAERFLKKAIPFLRGLGVKALLTNDNNGGRHREGESNTRFYDYVDNHFYVDHPEFLDVPWRPPSRCPNENPILAGEPKIFSHDLTRGASRPYVISEWNFSGPGRYRALGGMLTGAQSSLQGWDGLWRFAYSHSDADVTPPERCRPGLFDCATDPLIQASDRASVCLFLRQDISEGAEASYSADKSTGNLRIVTPRTSGGFAFEGQIDAGPLRAEITGAPATVWVSSVDGNPIAASDRLLLTHLTDVQAEGNFYADETRRVILRWGRGGVIERGEASVELQVDRPEGLAVYELDTAGNRMGEVASKVRDGRLTFLATTHGPRGGRIYYEIVRAAAPSADKPPFLTMRLRANDTESLEAWRKNFREVAAHPGCCDEIWFSTGCGAPKLDWHRANAAVLAEAIRDCKAKGIVPSLQFQATLGHGDSFGTPELFAMKTWTGWTGPTGIETKYCNCPRQPAFLAYLREVSKIYAPLGFGALWIDDDLRIEHHQPSESYGKRAGCWCATCLAEFNAVTGAEWTRSALAQAVATNEVAAALWRAFQVDAICTVAKTVGEVFHELSPGTMLGYQHAGYEGVAEPVNAVLKMLHETSGRAVGSRPGGGSYYDDNPNEMVLKSIKSGWFRARLGDPDYVSVWTPEIESWPRTYYSRSPQGVLVEGFTALMYGMNAISFFISNGTMEDPALYGNTYWKTLAAAAPTLRGYARAIEGCRPVGFTVPGKPQIGIRRAAIPVLSGVGRRVGELTKDECARNVNMMTSADVQRLREDLDRRVGGLPAVVCSPFSGLMQVHVDEQDRPAAVALVNTRISAQGPVRVKVRGLPSDVRSVTWRALCRAPEKLPVERTDDGAFVTIPEIGAWNAGCLDFSAGRIGGMK